jgi:type II secretory pathway pseudopilin PulG
MYEKQTAGYFLICFVVIAVLGILSAIAVPHVGRMIARSEADARTTEFYKIQTAVTEMLYDSICGTLEPVGPTSDISQVCTRDIYPLVLSDYMDGESLESGCSYAFAADGAVMQMMP